MSSETNENPLRIYTAHSHKTSEDNKTGSWRYLKPRYHEKTAPCSTACPAGQDIGRIEMLTTQGLFKEAWETILLENPFPGICGRICFHPCEEVCNRRDFDDAVAIHTIERFLASTAGRYQLTPDVPVLPKKKETIAIAGAGPAGLSAAYFLSRLGYTCDVFETMSEPGGVLRWGIPPYRLPREVIAEEIQRIRDLGVTITCGKSVDQTILKNKSYDAVFMACGHARTLTIGIPGEDMDGVTDGLAFLKKVVQEKVKKIDGPILIIGGGNTAIDVARSVLRLGGTPTIVYRRRKEDMPAFAEEVDMAIEEGVQLQTLLAPMEIRQTANGLEVLFQPMKMDGYHQSGRAKVIPDGSDPQRFKASQVFKTVGLAPEESWYTPVEENQTHQLKLTHTFLVSQKDAPLLVYGGDLTTDTKSAVHAIASGKEAALALDVCFKKGMAAVPEELNKVEIGPGLPLSMEIYLNGERSQRDPHVVGYDEINTDYFGFASRIVQPRLLKEERIHSFVEIDMKISANLAIREAERCFNCGLCNQCDNCRLYCPDLAVIRDAAIAQGRKINYDYCKGCGICVVECPRNAMVLTEDDDK